MIDATIYKLLVLRPWQDNPTKTLLTKISKIPHVPVIQEEQRLEAKFWLQRLPGVDTCEPYHGEFISEVIIAENHPTIIVLDAQGVGDAEEISDHPDFDLLGCELDIPDVDGIGPLRYWTEYYQQYGLQPTDFTDLVEQLELDSRVFMPYLS